MTIAMTELSTTGETLSGLASNIISTYHVYTREELDALPLLAASVLAAHGAGHPELAGVASLIEELTADMLPHMMKEESVLFPYVDGLEEAESGDSAPPMACFGTVRNPVRMMMLEHERVAELLASLRSSTSGYAVPADASDSYRDLYRRLAEFEAATHEHIRVENDVYFPRAIELEDRIGL